MATELELTGFGAEKIVVGLVSDVVTLPVALTVGR